VLISSWSNHSQVTVQLCCYLIDEIKWWHIEWNRKNSAEVTNFVDLLVFIFMTGPAAVWRPRTLATCVFRLSFHTAEAGYHLHKDEV